MKPLPLLSCARCLCSQQHEAIRFHIGNLFDTSIPSEDRIAFRTVNWPHLKTRETMIRHQLPFKDEERFVQARLEGSKRNLVAFPFIQEVSVTANSFEEGHVVILVKTCDDWTTGPGVRFGSSGGKPTTRLSLDESGF